jgi:hypothetical protein
MSRMMMTRRSLVAGITTAIVARDFDALAAVSCTPFNADDVQRCVAGLQIASLRTARQRCESWCWAACIETIFFLHGFRVDQKRIAEKLFGTAECEPAVGRQIVETITGDWVDDRGREFSAQAFPLVDLDYGIWEPTAVEDAAHELANNNPLINIALGHATVLTALTYLRHRDGSGMPLQMVVRDPYPGNPNRRTLDFQEINGSVFLAAVHVAGL